MGD
ncbi:hypothetical protein CP02DC21_0707A, partial [Chlamydia psittaci 02DC21]|jgi:hypothetical protein